MGGMTVTDPLVQHGSRPWTIDDLAALPEGNRYELLGGSLLVSPPPDMSHCGIATELDRLLHHAAPADLYVSAVGLGIGFPDVGTYYVPDVIVFRRSALGRRTKSVKPADVLLVVEVLSPSAQRDRGLKRFDYALAGIPQYWIVDESRREITVLEQDRSSQHYQESIVVKAGERLVTDQPFPIDFDPAEIF
jgi:Uma2 family endonuclease